MASSFGVEMTHFRNAEGKPDCCKQAVISVDTMWASRV